MYKILILVMVTFAAMIQDIRCRKIPNNLVIAGFVGIALRLISGTCSLSDCIIGIIIPFLIFFPIFIFRGIGAGDVKLLCVCGGFIGYHRILYFLLIVLVMGVIQGFISAVIKHKKMLNGNLIPFAVSIFLGVVVFLFV